MANDVLIDKSEGKNIASAQTSRISAGTGIFVGLVVNTNGGTVVVYDNTSETGTKLASIAADVPEGTYTYNIPYSTGLTVVTGSTVDVTIIWRPITSYTVTSMSASKSPSLSPSVSPSTSPSVSVSPSASPSTSPSVSISPSVSPSTSPSVSISPSKSPSLSPSISPSISPSASPSFSPSTSPSVSKSPSYSPSKSPSLSPSPSPSGGGM